MLSWEEPGTVRSAPTNTSVGRVDELYAARELILTWRDYLSKTKDDRKG